MNSIVLFGSPNVGKTSIFNALTNSKEKISNFEGATVVRKSALINNTNINLIDLPGVDSINGDTIVEEVVFNELIHSEMIIAVIDATNFKRNSYMLIELLEMNKPTNLVINMMDIFNGEMNVELLSKLYSSHIEVATKNKKDINIEHLIVEHKNNFVIDYGEAMEEAIIKLESLFDIETNSRYLAIQFLKGNNLVNQFVTNLELANIIREKLNEEVSAKSIAGHVFNIRRQFINHVIKEAIVLEEPKNELNFLNKHFDKIALHKFWGFILFIFIMWGVFYITFNVTLIQSIVDVILNQITLFTTNVLLAIDAGEILTSFIIDGVLAGVMGAITFIPQMLILFSLLAVLEGVGYFSRITALFEDLFNKLGLSSHSLIPYITGFGCNVLSIMATRTIKSEPKRIATILTSPFISCSARLPIYIIFISVFFNEHQALVLLFLYLLGIVVAVLIAYIIDKKVYKEANTMAIHSLPKYKMIEFKYFIRIVYAKLKAFVKRATKFILLGSMILWLITHFGMGGFTMEVEQSIVYPIAEKLTFLLTPIGITSVAVTLSLFSSFLAKELAVTTILVAYGATTMAELSTSLQTDFNEASALAYLVFVLLYIPCLSTLAAIKVETGSYKFVVYSIGISLSVGYVLAFFTYHIALLFI